MGSYEVGAVRVRLTCGNFPKSVILFGGPNNKVYYIWGSIFGSPYLGKWSYLSGTWLDGWFEILSSVGMYRV